MLKICDLCNKRSTFFSIHSKEACTIEHFFLCYRAKIVRNLLNFFIYNDLNLFKIRTFFVQKLFSRTKVIFVQIRTNSTKSCENRALFKCLIFNVITIYFLCSARLHDYFFNFYKGIFVRIKIK